MLGGAKRTGRLRARACVHVNYKHVWGWSAGKEKCANKCVLLPWRHKSNIFTTSVDDVIRGWSVPEFEE